MPIINLLVPLFERIAARIDASLEGRSVAWLLKERFVHIGIYVVLFVAILPDLKAPSRETTSLERYFAPSAARRTNETLLLIANDEFFAARYPNAVGPFGFLAEFRHYPDYHGCSFTDHWQTAGGPLRLTVRSREVSGLFVASGTQIRGTWTELPARLTPRPGQSLRAWIVREPSNFEMPIWLRRGSLKVVNGEPNALSFTLGGIRRTEHRRHRQRSPKSSR